MARDMCVVEGDDDNDGVYLQARQRAAHTVVLMSWLNGWGVAAVLREE